MGSFRCWRSFADLCGWDVPDSKSPPPSQLFRALGAMIDLSLYPLSPMVIRPAGDRIDDLLNVLMGILSSERLAPALAGKLYGKLMFLSSQYFGRLGRALLRAFSRRQHELNRFSLNPQIIAAVNFWVAHMKCLRPREIPVSLTNAPFFLSYSDGEGADAQIGVAIWSQQLKVWKPQRIPHPFDPSETNPNIPAVKSLSSLQYTEHKL